MEVPNQNHLELFRPIWNHRGGGCENEVNFGMNPVL